MSTTTEDLIAQMKKEKVPVEELNLKTADEVNEILTAVTQGEKSVAVPTATLAASFGEKTKDVKPEDIKKSLKKYDRRTTTFHIIPGQEYTKIFVLNKKEQVAKAKKAEERKAKLSALRAEKKAKKAEEDAATAAAE